MADEGRLEGRTALVTGSTSGIGLGTARALANEGANVVLNGFGERAEVERIEAELQALGVETAFDDADVRDVRAIESMVGAAGRRRFGRVDVLVHNAGIQHVARIEDFPVEKWSRRRSRR